MKSLPLFVMHAITSFKIQLKKGEASLKRILLSLLFVSLLTVIAACGFDESNEQNQNNNNADNGDQEVNADSDESTGENAINLFESSEIPTLDSSHAHDTVNIPTLNNINEGLYRDDENHQPQLALAESDELNEDETEHTFTLKETTWSNGDPVTAHDFEYAWKRTFEEVGHYADMFVTANIKNAQEILDEEMDPDELGVEAKDDNTLVVTLESPNPLFKNLMAFPTFFPQNQEFVEEKGDDYGTEADNVLFNGPFVLDSWEHDKGWVMKKNPDYWDAENVELDKINVNVVKDTSTLVNLWETGELDRIELSSSYVDEYKDDDSFVTEERPSIIFLRMNHNQEAFQNADIRKALDMSVDKESMTDVILNDGSKPLYGLIPSDFSFTSDEEDFRDLNGSFNEGSAEEAQELWEKGLEEIGEEGLDMKLTVSDDESHQKVAEYIKDQLESNLDGMSLEIKKVPFEARLEQEKDVDYDMVISTWAPDYNDPLTFLEMWMTDGSANRMDYSDEKYDDLIDKIREETDESKRFDMMLEAEKTLMDEMHILPMVQDADAILMKQNIDGFVRHPAGAGYDYKWTKVK